MAQQLATIPCDVIGCPNPAKFKVRYSWTKEEGYNLCADDLDKTDEKGNQYFRRTAVSIISLGAMPNVQ